MPKAKVFTSYSITKVPPTLIPDPRSQAKKSRNQDPKVEEEDLTEVGPQTPVLIQSTRNVDSSRETLTHSKWIPHGHQEADDKSSGLHILVIFRD